MSKGDLIGMKLIPYLILIASMAHGQSQRLALAFRIDEKDFIPEGITWDKGDNHFFIGGINKRKIVRVDAGGKVSDFVQTGQDGLGQVLGLHVDDERRLWACNNEAGNKKGGKAQVHVYDLNTGQLIHMFQLSEEEEVHLFNDVVVVEPGVAYVTDSDHSTIYRLDLNSKTIEPFIHSDQLRYCNGIAMTPDATRLAVSTARGFQLIDLSTKALSRLPMNYLSIADGLYRYNSSLIAIQNVFFPVSIVRFDLNQKFDEVIEEKLLVVNHPSFKIPTTGVVVGNWFYFIANSQLDQLDGENIINPDKLQPVEIWKIKLD